MRLLTEKAVGTRPPKSRGIAFLELSSSAELQTCLRLHHSQLSGRRINVELTAGGGGKSDARKAKLAERNKRIGGQREKRAEREKEEGGEADPGIGEGKAAWEEPREEEEAPAGYKMRGGRRVKVKGKVSAKGREWLTAGRAAGEARARGGVGMGCPRGIWGVGGARGQEVGADGRQCPPGGIELALLCV